MLVRSHIIEPKRIKMPRWMSNEVRPVTSLLGLFYFMNFTS